LPISETPAVEDNEDDEDEWVEKEAFSYPPNDETLDELLEEAANKDLKRDDWMETPGSLGVEYVHSRKPKEPMPKYMQSSASDYQLKVHKNELNPHIRNISKEVEDKEMQEEPAQHEVNYTFGDAGSSWRMTKLKAVYRQAKETGKPVAEIALERFEDLREFDDAREEEIELENRKVYGEGYVGKIKPSGELFEERKLSRGIHRLSSPSRPSPPLPQGEVMEEAPPPTKTEILDQTALNKLKAQMMRAKMRGGPEAGRLEAEYNVAVAAAANRRDPEVVVLSTMENRRLAGDRAGEVKMVDTKRGRERGLVEENEDMTIEDMVRQERRNKGRNEGMALAERIGKDAKFKDDLDYLDDNAEKIAKQATKSDLSLRNMAIGDFQKMTRVLESCPLCYHEDKDQPPLAPVVSLGTRVYLTLPTEPDISEGGACIVPLQHHLNLLECDDDEWEEIRNFMKCLIRMYHSQGRSVIFYENAAAPGRKLHAAMMAVPLPDALGETAPAYFREAFLVSDDEWSQHKKLIDTLAAAKQKGMGRSAFRRSLVKEMPYFHVWFEIDGGMGHVIENEGRWPKGDLFAREVLGGMLDVGPEVYKRQGRWNRSDRRVEPFRKQWSPFDWTKVLVEGGA
jgi:Protein similar to CwfJ C-terminus 2/Protein similar to CwfJ C-terminus 1